MVDAKQLRELLLKALPEFEEVTAQWQAVDLRTVYLPPSHHRALRFDTTLVVGMRGSGKSFWWTALQDKEVRALLEYLMEPEEAPLARTRVVPGFGAKLSEDYPDREELRALLRAGCEPERIWRTVVLTLLTEAGPLRAVRGWQERVAWVQEHPSEAADLLRRCDARLADRGERCLVVFDALDQSASDWSAMDQLVRGLLQAALHFRGTRCIRLKCFLRTDQVHARRIGDFPDASKILATQVELHWTREDLYGLLWQHLANPPERCGASIAAAGRAFRRLAARHGLRWREVRVGTTAVYRGDALAMEEADRRRLFHALAGDWMGRDPRRGLPYTWIPNHLADAAGQTSPRSFLVALRAAAEDTATRHPDHPYALHYESIKAGVQQASRIRVHELEEDHPWVQEVMRPLRGLLVPCEFQAIQERWEKEGVFNSLQRVKRLPPPHLPDGPEGLRVDLEALGIFQNLEDGRVNVPDVFRVGYGLGRKGGVRPVRGPSAG